MTETFLAGAAPHVDHSRRIAGSQWHSFSFRASKRALDLAISLALLPILGLIMLVLLLVNPVANRGALFYVQERMGRGCVPFMAIKFRTMRSAADGAVRSAEAPLEVDRITPLGRVLRKTRIDELPQILNVLLGDMSLIGPRPDFYGHAVLFLRSVPGYRKRHLVRPGISGLAQTEIGYAEGIRATERKVQADLYYVANTGLRMELWLIWRTLSVIARRQGS